MRKQERERERELGEAAIAGRDTPLLNHGSNDERQTLDPRTDIGLLVSQAPFCRDLYD